MLPASETLLLNNMAPVWTSLIAIFVMRTRSFNIQYLCTLTLAIGGTLFVAKPPFMAPIFNSLGYQMQERDAHDENLHLIGVLIGILGSMLNSANQVFTSKLGSLSTVQIFEYSVVTGTIYSVIAYIIHPNGELQIPSIKDIILIISILGVLNVLVNVLIVKSFLLGDLVTISLISLSAVIYGFFFDVFIFGSPLDMISFFGCGFIMGGMAVDILLNGPKEK